MSLSQGPPSGVARGGASSGGSPGLGNPHAPCVFEHRAIMLAAVESIIVVAVIVTTALRAIVRLKILRSPSWDDLLLILAFVSTGRRAPGTSVSLMADP